jgi:beta-glucosidase
VTLQSTLVLPCLIDKESTVGEWMADQRGQVLLNPFYEQVKENSRKVFGGGERYGDSIGMDVMDMILEMPLLSVLKFQQRFLPMPTEEMLDNLLAQVHK